MATPTNPSFGAGFNAQAFRDAITSTMEMGLPQDVSERATFRWHPTRTYSSSRDASGKPYSWTQAADEELTHPDVQIPCAIEFSSRPAATLDTPVGQFDSSRAVITILDTHYPLVEGADLVLLDRAVYTIDSWGPPVGLFTVTVYSAYCTAMDEF